MKTKILQKLMEEVKMSFKDLIFLSFFLGKMYLEPYDEVAGLTVLSQHNVTRLLRKAEFRRAEFSEGEKYGNQIFDRQND